MARRRKNHGQATQVGQLAEQALASLIPAGQLRLARIQLAWIEAVPAHLRPMAAPAAHSPPMPRLAMIRKTSSTQMFGANEQAAVPSE